ncbi:hypothetical protein RF11_13388 [Thelohanellus kitauei]|uniref:Uncharacterized protein n=1 Tax=Thelohanellus kitauei TaxID=669202 RepID=A0A0C2MEP9_THEKT|nr:hypothetical protein RF11_13388 [Thelohanellus kitauei]
MILLTLCVFLPNLITTSLKKHECQFNNTVIQNGIVKPTQNDSSADSVFRESSSNHIFVVCLLIVSTYAAQILRIGLIKTPFSDAYQFMLMCLGLIVTSLASGKKFTNIEIIHLKSLYNLNPFIESFSENLKHGCVTGNVSALLHLPLVIFCLNMLEILLFVLYHMEISINPIRITFVGKDTINMQLNPNKRDKKTQNDNRDVNWTQTHAN